MNKRAKKPEGLEPQNIPDAIEAVMLEARKKCARIALGAPLDDLSINEPAYTELKNELAKKEKIIESLQREVKRYKDLFFIASELNPQKSTAHLKIIR